MNKKVHLQSKSKIFLISICLLSTLLGAFIGVYIYEGYTKYLFVIFLLACSFIGLYFLIYRNVKSEKLDLSALILGIYVFLFSIGRLSISRIDFFNRPFPIHLFVLPIILILYITHIFLRKRKSYHVRNLLNKEIIFSALLIISLYASIFVARNRTDAFITTAELSVYFLGYFVFSYLVTSFRLWIKLLWVYVFTTSIILLNSIYLFVISPLHYSRLVASEIKGPNQYSLTLLFGFLLFFGLMFSEDNWKKRAMYILMMSLFGLGIILTFSRGAWISVSIGAIIFLLSSLKYKSVRKTLPIVLISIIVILSISIIGIINDRNMMDRLGTLIRANQNRAVGSSAARILIYNEDFNKIKDSPILGIGLGQVIIYDHKYDSDLINAHSSYLGIWVGSGTFALIFFLLFLIQHGVNLLRIRGQLNRNGLLGNILFASFVTFAILILVKNSIFDSALWGMLALQGAAINLYSIERSSVTK